MGSTKEEMKPSSSKSVKTVDASDMVGKKTGGIFGRWRNKNKRKLESQQDKAQNFADLLERFGEAIEKAHGKDDRKNFLNEIAPLMPKLELRIFDMITGKRQELKNESGREEYNRRALSRLVAMDWHFGRVRDRISEGYGPGSVITVDDLEVVEFDVMEIVGLCEEYGADK